MTNNLILNRLNQPQSNNMVDSFNQFKKSIQGQDPKALVMSLLNSGKMSREQFEQLSRQANSLMNILK